MRKYAETILTVIITFIMSLVLNSGLYYVTREHGAIKIGAVININNQNYMILDIENYNSDPVNGLTLAIPSSTATLKIISSHPLAIEEPPSAVGNSQIKYVVISGVEPRATVELLIPIYGESEKSLIRFTNLDKLGFSVSPKGNGNSPFQIALQESLRIAIINSLLYGIVAFWSYAELEKNKKAWAEDIKNNKQTWTEESQKLKLEVEKTKEELTQMQEYTVKEIKKADNRFQRARIYLIAKLSDYQKELDFWRDTIRKLLYESKVDKITVETLFNQVTKSLKSYSVQERGIDYKAIETLANLLNNENKE